MEDLLKALELSKALGVPEGTLTDWRYKGTGPAYIKIGKHIRYSRATVEAWLSAHVVKTA